MSIEYIHLTFNKPSPRYWTVVSEELSRWPIHIKKRKNHSWSAWIHQPGTTDILWTDIGQTRDSIAQQAAQWLVANQEELYLKAVMHEAETKAFLDMIAENDVKCLEAYTGKPVTVGEDKNGDPYVELDVPYYEDEDDDDDEEYV